ncbi:sugar/nucleoside kinase (ribokinase family) [Motilibacter rhizosphaerae]|uniref:Sugar/nucleoside kinase (Ribokinase family) n=1 Tax=Motilibacter rhizosphaerae TaxID=598652 RepID=A0A4Q7NG52_9ACTN|nr:carbohydrate kinase family protein [Motilibacter rhizosphaerae]RZS82754.1 sugar/nucleoside kinase (ribokinase family) [Motilibacter rhizosphaerae]
MESGDAVEHDLWLHGTVYLDIVLTGLPAMPAPGAEVWAQGMGSCPGGVANLAVAAARLGLRTTLASTFGDDVYGDFCWSTLTDQEGVDLRGSRRVPGWHSPVTVSLAVSRDRSMVTHEHRSPVAARELLEHTPPARAGFVHLASDEDDLLAAARARGGLLFADLGWDPAQEWPTSTLDRLAGCHAFLPNSVEAMAYTRTEDPRAALARLADRVPLAVVTCGGQGSIAVDATTGEEEWAPSLPVDAYDPTGAGDVFGAALVLGTLEGWPLAQRLAFANLCAALSVQEVGGSLAAPGWGDLADWWARVSQEADAGSTVAREWRARYAFLPDVLPPPPLRSGRRASATLARASDA